MVFSRQDAKRIAAGRKTQHRLPRARVAPELLTMLPISYQEPNPALGFDRQGRPRRDSVRACYVTVLSVVPGMLWDATLEDAEREGYADLAALMEAWGNPVKATPVWIMRFRVDRQHRPRYLSRRVVAGRESDYTDVPARALPHEPEAVDDDTLARFTAEARERDADRVLEAIEERARQSFDAQVREYERLARERHLDIRSELRALRRWSGNPEAQSSQLERIRAKVDGHLVASGATR